MASLRDQDIEKDIAVTDAPKTTATAAATSVDHGVESSSESGLDDNYHLFKATAGLEYTPAEARRVVRKIDWRVVTVLFVTYLLQYLDKSEYPDYPRARLEPLENMLRGLQP